MKKKSIMYATGTKVICVILSLCFAFSTAFFVTQAIRQATVYDIQSIAKGERPADVTQTVIAQNQYRTILGYASEIALIGDGVYAEQLLQDRKKTVLDEAVRNFAEQKASIIRSQLYDMLSDFASDERFSDTVGTYNTATQPTENEMTEVSVPAEGTTFVPSTEPAVTAVTEVATETEQDGFVPVEDATELVGSLQTLSEKRVEQIYTILENGTTADILALYPYVSDSICNMRYDDSMTVNLGTAGTSGDYYIYYSHTTQEAYDLLSDVYDSLSANVRLHSLETEYMQQYSGVYLSVTDADGNEIYSHGQKQTSPVKTLSRTGGIVTENGFAELYTEIDYGADYLQRWLGESGNNDFVLEIGEPTEETDPLYVLYKWYERDARALPLRTNCIIAVVSLFACVLFFALYLVGCGKENGENECRLLVLDRIPGDLHTLISLALLVGLGFAAVCTLIFAYERSIVSYEGFYGSEFVLTLLLKLIGSVWLPVFIGLCGLLFMGVLTEWVSGLIRCARANYPWLKKTLAVRLLVLFGRTLRWIGRHCKTIVNQCGKTFRYRPQHFERSFYLMILGVFLINLLAACGWFFGIPVMIVVDGIFAWKVGKYIRDLDSVITASGEHKPVDDTTGFALSLRTLNDNLQYTNDELRKAVAAAVRDEKTKTELITNVSHDLKTPLTGIINYVDLLSKCDIQDETAVEYIGVLNEKSLKLKRLIEDLIEASKVSTGNVTLHPTVLDFAELTVQAVVEHSASFEKNGLDLRFTAPETPVRAYADGQKTYRILENLLTNAWKYAANGSRVYAAAYEKNGEAVFEIKNTSAQPLNISAEELTERFVRGDSSRSTDGNGLGLSIARELCTLQNGRLEISIDGDLFKAIVSLPQNE